MKKLIVILMLIPFIGLAQITEPKINAQTVDGSDTSDFVRTTALNKVIGQGTVNQLVQTDGAGTWTYITNAAFTGIISIDATNPSAVKLFRAGDTITVSFGHNHLEYFLVTGGVINGNVNFNLDAQSDDDYEISLVGITSLEVGLTVTFIANTANTDGCTLEITQVGDVDAILKMHDQVLVTGDIESGQVVVCVWDGSNFQMTSQVAQ